MMNNEDTRTDDPVAMKDAGHHRKRENHAKGGKGSESRTENLGLLNNKEMRGGFTLTQISNSTATLRLLKPNGTATGACEPVTECITLHKPIFNKKASILDAEINAITKRTEEDTNTGTKTEKSKSQTATVPLAKERGQTGDDATGKPPDLGSRIVERFPKYYLPESEIVAMIANHAT